MWFAYPIPNTYIIYLNTGIVCHYNANHCNLQCTCKKQEKTQMKWDASWEKGDVSWEKWDTSWETVATYFWVVLYITLGLLFSSCLQSPTAAWQHWNQNNILQRLCRMETKQNSNSAPKLKHFNLASTCWVGTFCSEIVYLHAWYCQGTATWKTA